MTFDLVKCMAGDQMEGDLVTRLRIWSEDDDAFINDICGNAANRIEELETALREIETVELDPRNSGQMWVEALRQIARKALGEKKDGNV